MKLNLKKGLMSVAMVTAIGTTALGTSGAAFASTQSSSHHNTNNSYSTSVGSAAESSHFDGATHDLFSAVTTQSYHAPTGTSMSSFDLDASKGFVANIGYSKSLMWANTSGTEVNSDASHAASGFGYANQASNYSNAKTTSASSGTATVAIQGHVAADDTIHVDETNSSSADGSHSSSSSIQSSKTGEVSGTNSTTLTWNNSTSSQNSSGASESSSHVPTFTWNPLTHTWSQI